MQLRKLLALALIGGLVAGSLTTADAAKKKKKKKVKLVSQASAFYLRNTSECGDLSAMSLSLTDGEDTDCYSPTNAAGAVAGYTEYVYSASDGVPFKLDAKTPITGTITIRNGNSVGAGQGGVTFTLSGTAGGKEAAIATWESDSFTIAPAGVQTLEWEAEPSAKLHNKKITSLALTVTPSGTTVGFYGTVEHDGPPPSVVNVSRLIKKK